MEDILDVASAALIVARDWITLLAALGAVLVAMNIRRDLRRRASVFADGNAEPVSDKTLRVTLRLRNQTLRDIRVRRIEVRRPRPAILAMEGIYEPGPGPIDCNHIVPALERGTLTFLIGSPAQRGRHLQLRVSYNPDAGRRARRRIHLSVDPTATLAVDAGDAPEAVPERIA